MMIVTLDDLPWWRAIRRELRTPKGYLLLVLALLSALAAARAGAAMALPGLLAPTVVAGFLDTALLRLRRGRWVFPDGALITGLIIGLIIAPQEPVYVPCAAAALAVGSKYALRTRRANIFNPAALGLVAAAYAFGSAESWWGSLPDLPLPCIAILLAAGFFIANHVNKLPAVFAFAAAYFGLCATIAFLGEPARVAEIFRVPQVNAAIFFAAFMVTDPPTTPVRYPNQLRFGIIVGVVGAVLFLAAGGVAYLPAGLLAGNAWEAWERVQAQARRDAGGRRAAPAGE